MKTSARFLSMLLAVLMIAGAALTVSAFPDVEAGYKYGEAINVLSQLDVLGGFEDGSFKPEENVTRAQMAKLAYVLYTTFVDAGTGSVKFDDVAASHWANGYISWCYNKEIIGGFGDGTYAPEAPVTYDQALKIVCGVLGYTEWDSKLWPTDVRQVALRQLSLGKNLEDVKGTDELTRGQVAQIMYNALKAPMKETKVEYHPIDEAGKIKIPVEVEMTLAADVWGFTETTYVVAGTKNYSIADIADDAEVDGDQSIDFAKTGSDVAVLLYNADAKKDKTSTPDLKDLGLEAYENNTDALIGLSVVTVTKDDEILGAATIKGYYKDGVEVAVSADGKTLTVDGQKFTYADSADIAMYTYADGMTTSALFAEKVVVPALNAAKGETDALDAPYFARAFDFDGDGEFDGLMVLPLVGYMVDDIVEKTVDGEKVKFVDYDEIDGTAMDDIELANATAELAEDDVFVGVLLAGKLVVVEVIKPVEAYATSISTSAQKVTINGTSYSFATADQVAGAQVLTGMDADVLGEEATTNYWFYNGAVIKSDDVAPNNAYNFAILVSIVADEDENTSNIVATQTYTATLIVGGKEVKVPLATVTVADGADEGEEPDVLSAKDAEEIYPADTIEDGVRVYNYALVTEMAENSKGTYDLVIAGAKENLDAEKYAVLEAGDISYSATTGLYSFPGAANEVILDDESIIYYTYTDETDDSEGAFKYIGNYTKDTITKNKFADVTIEKAYAKITEDGMLVLLAAFVDGKIEGTTEGDSYKNNGSLILYAPYASEVVLDGGKKYNSYTFLDNATLTVADAIVNKEAVAGDVAGIGGVNLYALNNAGTGYTKLDSTKTVTADAENYKSLDYGTITKVSAANGYVWINNNAVVVNDSVKIWGLTDADEAKQLTISDLATMFKLTEEAELDIRVIKVMTVVDAQTTVVNSLIVEIFEKNESDVVESVFADLHDNFFPVEE